MSKPVIAVWFSCGAASAVAAKLTIEKYGDTHEIRVLNNPVAEEDEDNVRFLHDVEVWLGIKIESVVNPMFPNASAVEVWDHQQYMSGIAGAPCTKALKKLARKHWEQSNRCDHVFWGLRQMKFIALTILLRMNVTTFCLCSLMLGLQKVTASRFYSKLESLSHASISLDIPTPTALVA